MTCKGNRNLYHSQLPKKCFWDVIYSKHWAIFGLALSVRKKLIFPYWAQKSIRGRNLGNLSGSFQINVLKSWSEDDLHMVFILVPKGIQNARVRHTNISQKCPGSFGQLNRRRREWVRRILLNTLSPIEEIP